MGVLGKTLGKGLCILAVATSKLSRYERLNIAAAAGIGRTISVLFWARGPPERERQRQR